MNKSLNNKKLDTYLGFCNEVYELNKSKALSDAYTFYKEYVKAATYTPRNHTFRIMTKQSSPFCKMLL